MKRENYLELKNRELSLVYQNNLLHTVYKIGPGCTCIANRIKQILPILINGDQTGFIPGRSITENTSLIYDIMNSNQVKSVSGLILLIDVEKDFYTVSSW